MEELGKAALPEWRVLYDSSDVKNIKKEILGPRHVIINIFGYRLNIYIMDIVQIENDLCDNKITLEEANNQLRDEFKKQLIYKLIMEN
jgi:hypothetical protein